MEPKIEQPKQYTPEEIAQLEKSRTISDAELLKGGAEYVVDEKGEKENLLVSEEQKNFLENRKLQETIDILNNAFGIQDPESREKRMRNVSLEDMMSIISTTDKALYISYSKGAGSSLRLWNGKPHFPEGSSHVDWGTNYSIALAQNKTAGIYDINRFLDEVKARGDFGTREVSLYRVN